MRPLSHVLETVLYADDLEAAEGFYRELLGPPAEMFRFFRGDPMRTGRIMDIGAFPWWTDPTLKAEFLQALTVFTHRLDYALWPDSPPLMHAQIHQLERMLAPQRDAPIKLSVVYRDDAFGHGLRLSLTSLVINDKPLAHPDNRGAVLLSMYETDLRDMPSLIAAQLAFRPDIVVLAGAAEGVNDFLEPFELQLRVNGGATELHQDPSPGLVHQWRSLVLPVSLSSLRAGTNTIEIHTSVVDGLAYVANVELLLR